MVVNDNADVPADGNACTDDICTAGVPSNPNLSAGTTCGTNQMCNGQGACVGCLTAANCGTDTACRTFACTNNQCVVTNVAVGHGAGDPDGRRLQEGAVRRQWSVADRQRRHRQAGRHQRLHAGPVHRRHPVEPARDRGHGVQPERRHQVQRQRQRARLRPVPGGQPTAAAPTPNATCAPAAPPAFAASATPPTARLSAARRRATARRTSA